MNIEQSGIEVLEMKDPKTNKAYPSIPPGHKFQPMKLLRNRVWSTSFMNKIIF